jgi:hypothetical protein
MKMLFFSTDGLEMDQISRELVHAGIPCEVRCGSVNDQGAPEKELWVQNDGDRPRGFMLCVQLGLGFARRTVEPVEADA